jgi:addiction module HigA family antidote
MSSMHNPPHPGEILRDDVPPALGITVTEAARQLGVTRLALSRELNGHASISPDMAPRLEAWPGPKRGGRGENWLAQRTAYDAKQARQKPALTHADSAGIEDTVTATRSGLVCDQARSRKSLSVPD